MALDVLGFSQFKCAYEEVMEGHALVNEERISKGEFSRRLKAHFEKLSLKRTSGRHLK